MFTSLKDLVKQRKAAATSGAAKAKVAQFEKQMTSVKGKSGARREEFALPSTGGVVAGVVLAVILAVVFKDTVIKTLQKM